MLLRPACTDSVPPLSRSHICSVFISNGNQKMKSHPQSSDLPGSRAPLLPNHVALRTVHRSRATGRDSGVANHESSFTRHSSLVTQHCCFLISTAAIRNRRNPLKQHAKCFSNRSIRAGLGARFARGSHAAHHQPQSAARRFLIATRPGLEIRPTRSQQTRTIFLIASFSGCLSYARHLATQQSGTS
jgi:hypothetical protein